MRLFSLTEIKKVEENHILKFQPLRLIHCQAQHVLQERGDGVFLALLADNDHLVAAKLRFTHTMGLWHSLDLPFTGAT